MTYLGFGLLGLMSWKRANRLSLPSERAYLFNGKDYPCAIYMLGPKHTNKIHGFLNCAFWQTTWSLSGLGTTSEAHAGHTQWNHLGALETQTLDHTPRDLITGLGCDLNIRISKAPRWLLGNTHGWEPPFQTLKFWQPLLGTWWSS